MELRIILNIFRDKIYSILSVIIEYTSGLLCFDRKLPLSTLSFCNCVIMLHYHLAFVKMNNDDMWNSVHVVMHGKSNLITLYLRFAIGFCWHWSFDYFYKQCNARYVFKK